MILKTYLDRALERVRKTVAVALLGIPAVERRDGEEVAAGGIDAEIPYRPAQLDATCADSRSKPECCCRS